MPYSPSAVLEQLGIPVLKTWLRDTWGAWSPVHNRIVIARGLSPVQERCVLAHELEHVLALDAGCAVGPPDEAAERRADHFAARKLIAISDLCEVAQRVPEFRSAAAELRVTERFLRIRLDDLQGEGWPWHGEPRAAG